MCCMCHTSDVVWALVDAAIKACGDHMCQPKPRVVRQFVDAVLGAAGGLALSDAAPGARKSTDATDNAGALPEAEEAAQAGSGASAGASSTRTACAQIRTVLARWFARAQALA